MAKKNVMRFELLMDAGNGAQKAGDILIKTLAKSGRYVYIEPIIPAEISPPKRTPHSLSGVMIRVASNDVTCIGSDSELMLVEHEILLKRRLQDKEYSQGAVVLLDMAESARFKDAFEEVIKEAESVGLKVVPFHMSELAQDTIKELNGNGKNMFYLGVLSAVYQVPFADVEQEVRSTFKKLSEEKLLKNITILKEGYSHALEVAPDTYEIAGTSLDGDHILLDGNTALSLGAIDAGIKVFSGYPITPASSIMHTLAKVFPSYGGMVHQAEDEIAAIGTAVGSYYAGVPAMTATSGPGLSLKQEFIGFAMTSEIPLVVVDVQRGGPSTGLPTRTEQSDLFAAAFGSHGDSTKIVLSVAGVEDCFYAPHVARYLTETLRVPVFIMSDYLTSVSYRILQKMKTIQLDDVKDIPDTVLARFGLKRLPENIEMVKQNQSVPGEPELMRRLTGLNTDKGGNVMYSSESNERSHTVRNEKIHHVRRALLTPEIIGEPEGDILVVGWGSARGALLESIEKAQAAGLKASALHLKIVYPLPLMLKDIFKRFKRVVTIEMMYGDDLKPTPLAMMLRSETLVDVKNVLTRATGRPLKPKEIVTALKALV